MDDQTATEVLAAEARRLQAARAAVERECVEIGAEQAMDPISDATLLEREIDESLLHQLDQELRDVEAARLRVAAGSYGRCDVCGTAIADDRLRAVPATTRCTAHQSEAEILLESRMVDGADSPSDAMTRAANEATQNLDLVPNDDVVPDDEGQDPASPEDLAMHVRKA
jgi:RNA polymerase-binding transcription factor DksA